MIDGYFGESALPVFVAPFHGYALEFVPLLAKHGIDWISFRGARRLWTSGATVRDVNVQACLFDWGNKRFGEEGKYLTILVDHLHARRLGMIDREEITGILTHHLVQDAASYEFITQLFNITEIMLPHAG